MPNSSPVSGISDKKRKSLSTYWAAESAGPQTTIVVRPWALLPSSHGNSAGDAAGQRDAEEPPERLEAAIEPSPETAPEESAGRGVGCFEHMTQKIKERVIEHYTIPDSTPSMEEIEADRWVGFPPSIIVPRWGIQWYGHQLVQAKFARWMLLPAALVLQLCVGSFYAWSGYNAAIDSYIYGDDTVGRAPITFYVAVATFGPSAAVLGPWLERTGPRSAAIFGSCMYFIGQLLAALAIWLKQIGLLYVGYGVIGGCGLGISYIAPVSPIQKWFPDRRGLASGVAVCGFGAGAIIAPYAQAALIRSVGIVLTFVVLGAAYFSVMITLSMLLRVPPPGFTVGGVKVYQKAIRGTDLVADALSQIREARWENQKIIGAPFAGSGDNDRTSTMVSLFRSPGTGGGTNTATGMQTDPLLSPHAQSDNASNVSVETQINAAGHLDRVPSAVSVSVSVQEPSHEPETEQNGAIGSIAERNARNALNAEKMILDRMDTEDDLMARKQLQDMLRGYTLIDAIVSNEFRLMYYMLFANAVLGLTTISKLQDMVKNQFGKSPEEAVIINSIASIFNLSGRVILALVSDTTGRKTIFLFTLATQAIFCGCLPIIFHTTTYWAFVFAICAVSLCYGTGFGVIPAFLADMFGAQNVGATHGIILTTWSLGGVIGAIVYNQIVNQAVSQSSKTNSDVYNRNFMWILPIIGVAVFITAFLRTNIEDRLLPRQPGELLRLRVFGHLFFFEKWLRIRHVSKVEETRLFHEFLTRVA